MATNSHMSGQLYFNSTLLQLNATTQFYLDTSVSDSCQKTENSRQWSFSYSTDSRWKYDSHFSRFKCMSCQCAFLVNYMTRAFQAISQLVSQSANAHLVK